MDFFGALLGISGFLAAAVLIVSYICFRMAFYTSCTSDDVLELPQGEIYAPYRDFMESCARELRSMPCEELWTTAFDGVKLYGRYFEYAPGAPIELMFHGYRGSAERDLSGGVRRSFALGHSVILVDQRGCGKSDCNVITFGINEHRDCLSWLAKIQERFGNDTKIILTGISMGASTVLMAAGKPLPKNVIGVIADCGFTSAKEIIQVVIRQMGLPRTILYPFVRLGARLYGHFDLEETSALEALKSCNIPVIFFHGEDDAFVPCEMSRINYAACTSRKMLVTVPKAGHGLSYPTQPERYLNALQDFFDEANIQPPLL